jgi:tetratricopeptide (TPR) repeat protein
MNGDSIQRGLLLALLVFLQPSLKADSIPGIVAKAKPAIVEIVTTEAKGTRKILGTGFFVSPNGLVVTNQHVIEGADSITAVGSNGTIFPLERVVAQPVGLDLAVLKFHAADAPFLKLGESSTAVEGQKVIVIGNPKGTVSDGIISAFRENRSLFQITARISDESSGSPVMDEAGHVIGIAMLVSVEGQNLNFAIPVEKVPAALLEPPGSAPPIATLTPATDANAYFESGLAFLNQKQYDEAIGDFTEAIRVDPTYTLAYFNRGLAYDNRGNYDKAVSDYTEAIRLDPSFLPCYFNRGIAYGHKRNYDKAVSDYDEAIRLDPHYAPSYLNRGLEYRNKGNWQKAISDLTEAIRLDPNLAVAYFERGKAYSDCGRIDKAISDYTEAIRLDPNDGSVLSDRGDAYHSQSRLDEAVCDYTDAIRLNPNNAHAYVNRGITYSDQGKLDAAISDFTHAIRLDPNNRDAYKHRGSTYLRAGDSYKAYADFATVGRLKSRPIKDIDSPPK